MPVEVILPKVDMDMSHGTVARWHVAEGAVVTKGAALFDIETDKAAMEVEAPASGRLQAVTAKDGDRVPVGTVVALIYAEGEALPDAGTGPAGTQRSRPTGTGAVEVILPKVDMDMSHGTLARWHVAEGEAVTKGAALFDIETDKAAMEVEAPASGVLHHVSAQAGDRVAVGTVLAYLYPTGVTVGERPVAAVPETASAPETKPEPAIPHAAHHPAPPAHDTGDRKRATPAARAAARQARIALEAISGSGPRGRIQRGDVEDFLARPARADGPPLPLPAGFTPQSGPLHVSQRRGSGTPLLLLHGFASDSQSWAPLEKVLGPDRALIRIDLPSHGKSPLRRIGGFPDLARMVVEAFDRATADLPPVHLLGHSLGGGLAIALADIRPRKVASLSLIAPAGLGPEIDGAALNGIVRASRTESLAPWLKRLTARPETIGDDYAKAAMRARASGDLRAAQAEMADALFPDGVQSFDLRAAMERLDCPTSLIWGREDHVIPHRHALGGRTDAALHLLAGAGHIPQFECPERVARIVARQTGSSL